MGVTAALNCTINKENYINETLCFHGCLHSFFTFFALKGASDFNSKVRKKFNFNKIKGLRNVPPRSISRGESLFIYFIFIFSDPLKEVIFYLEVFPPGLYLVERLTDWSMLPQNYWSQL